MFEEHAKQRDLRLDREAPTWFHSRKDHRNCVPFRWRKAAAASNCERSFKRGALCVRIPGVPVMHVRIDLEDGLRRCRNGDAVFDLHLAGEQAVAFVCAA